MSLPLLAVADQPPQGKVSLTAKLAAYFTAHPNVWIDGMTLSQIAGHYAWRSRVSDLRKPPYGMTIENRQRRVRGFGGEILMSEYRYVPREHEEAA